MKKERFSRGVKSICIALGGGLLFLSLLAHPAQAYYLMGDANEDGVVNGDDLLRWQANLFTGSRWEDGDFTGDQNVNGDDLLVWQANLFNTAPPPAPQPGPTVSNPEPVTAALCLMGVGSIGAALRRRRSGLIHKTHP